MTHILIDGKQYDSEAATTVLQVARANGIQIPTLCYHPALKPSGSCKICAVEVLGRSQSGTTMLSCILRVKDGLAVRTQGLAVDKARSRAFLNLFRLAPHAPVIRNLAESCGIDLGPSPDGCIRCRFCIRVCKEIVGAGALKMEKRNGQSCVVPEQGLCIGCGTCANICPTRAIRIEDKESVRIITIREEIIGVHALQRCEGCGRYFATQRFLDHVHEQTATHPDVKAHHRYCPTCSKLFSDRIVSVHDRPQKLIR